MIALPTSYCSIAQQVIALFDQGKVPPLSSLIDSGTRENFNLFSLQNGSQYLLPRGNSSYSMLRTWAGSVA